YFVRFPNLVINGSAQALLDASQHNIPVALFEFLQHFPLSSVTSIIGVVLVVTFFVTSSDSGSLVIDIIASGGAKEPVLWHRVFWALLEGFLAISLLYSGGLSALQTASIASAFPLVIILFFICIALVKALREDYLKLSSIQTHTTSVQYTQASTSWQKRLDSLLEKPDKAQAIAFLKQTVRPALHEVSTKLKDDGINIHCQLNPESIRLVIPKLDMHDFVYSVHLRAYLLADTEEKNIDEADEKNHYYRAEVFLEHGSQQYDIMGYTQEQVIADVITQYEKYLYYLHISTADKTLA
uniref:BCCT family transporter n=1 Tax=Facilibium subflavum TaxID=2219058 RepID=UPI001AADF243